MQNTLTNTVTFEGKGLHNGVLNKVTLKAAAVNTGIVFKRQLSVERSTLIAADWMQIYAYPACTCLKNQDGYFIRTVEHLLAALYACEIDNAVVEMEGDEIPILDGSAKPLVEMLAAAGKTRQSAERKFIRILKAVECNEKDRFIRIEPAEQFEMDLSITLSSMGTLNWSGVMTPDVFQNEIMAARSFGALRNGILVKLFGGFLLQPLYRGVSMDCVIVLFCNKVINREGLRYRDEYVRHRVLDVVGDLRLSGAGLLGKVTAFRTSHSLNQRLLKTVFSDPRGWEWV